MLCSEREMEISDDHDGIIDLDDDAPIGTPFATYAGLDDPIIEIAITPNRADCLGVRGVARDLAAAGYGRLKDIDTSPLEGSFDSPISWQLDLTPADEYLAHCVWPSFYRIEEWGKPIMDGEPPDRDRSTPNQCVGRYY